MISLITTGPTNGNAFEAPEPKRNSSTEAGKSLPKERALKAVKTGPTLETNRPKETPISAAPNLTPERKPERAPAALAVNKKTSSPWTELSEKLGLTPGKGLKSRS